MTVKLRKSTVNIVCDEVPSNAMTISLSVCSNYNFGNNVMM